MDELVNEQGLTEFAMEQIDAGATVHRKRKDVLKTSRVLEIIQQYDTYANKVHFLYAVGGNIDV